MTYEERERCAAAVIAYLRGEIAKGDAVEIIYGNQLTLMSTNTKPVIRDSLRPRRAIRMVSK
jgi:hypothetical protein